MNKCPNCGTKLPKSARSCSNCGYALGTSSTPASAKKQGGALWFKAHKKLVVVLSIVLVMVIVLAIALPIGIYNRHNGIYYYYENEQFDQQDYFKLSGRTWTDEDGESGTFTLKGNEITFYQETFGSNEILTSGTVKKGVLTLSISGAEVTYAKKGAVHVHEYKNWTVATPSTCIKQGKEQSRCKCGKTVTRPLPLADHNPSSVWAMDVGQHWRVCLVCGCTIDEGSHAYSGGACSSCGLPAQGTDGLTFQKNDNGDGYIVTGIGDAKGPIIRIPDKYDGLLVTAIGNEAFYDCDELTNVVIPYGVTSIGYDAFQECNGLMNVAFPYGLTSIGFAAFRDCNGLLRIEIPASVTSIEHYAFSGCPLRSITIPFVGATKDDTENTYFGYIFGASSVSENDEYVPHSLKSVIITGGSSIGAGAFSGCSRLMSVTIPDSVTEIGGSAFEGCGMLESVTIPDSVTSIGDRAFYSCEGLKSVTIPDSVTSIGDEAFCNCYGLISITIPNSVTSIGDEAFRYCSGLTGTLAIPEGVTSIGGGAFGGCIGLTSIIVKDGNPAYYCEGNCLIETQSKTLIAGCNTSQIPTDDSVTSIGDWAFFGCSGLTGTLVIPESVTSIGDYAFGGCSGLTGTLAIPDGVTSIGDYAFNSCSGFTGALRIPDGVTSIGDYVFCFCIGLTSVTIPNGVTSIGEAAFARCSGLTSITIPDSVTSIGFGAFDDCDGLTSVTIGSGVTSIGDYAFRGCSGLTGTLRIPDGVTSIGEAAFAGCSGLTSITIPDGVTSIGERAFYGTAYYNDIDNWDDSGVLYIGNYLIEAKNTISGAYTIRANTKLIANCAFYNCSGLTSITIPDSVTSMGEEAFRYCSRLTRISYNGTVSEWRDIEKKDRWWDEDTGDYIVTCTDGTVKKDGTVTMN